MMNVSSHYLEQLTADYYGMPLIEKNINVTAPRITKKGA